MNVIGIPPAEQDSVFRLVAGILHLGNLYFSEGGKGDAVIADPQRPFYFFFFCVCLLKKLIKTNAKQCWTWLRQC
jgi:myosin heavy subunit